MRSIRLILPLFVLGLMFITLQPAFVEAGVFDASSEVTYREYWVPHSEFTAGCDADAKPSGNSFYLEPFGCDKIVNFTIPDDFSQALKAEIYLDLWRNHDSKIARFKVNEKSTTYKPDVGSDWSRTPYIGDIKLSELQQGANQIRFWGGGYHVHDIAIRIYYDETHPLLNSQGDPHTAPTGSLVTLQDDSAVVDANTPATLAVNNNQLKLTANIGEGANYVEFHGYYFGYDEDNDGEYLDWHSRGRNNYYPGGTQELATGGTIDHIGTVDTPAAGDYTTTWNMNYIPDQESARFKIRIVGLDGNVREAAGGVSAEFALERTKPLIAFYDANFEDAILWHDGKYPETATRFLSLPSDLSDYETPIVLHSFWKRPRFTVNNSALIAPSFNNNDDWQLAVNSLNMNNLQVGSNVFVYSHQGGFGEFIEGPGPMIILRKKTPGLPDTTPPFTADQDPAPGATGVSQDANIVVRVKDSDSGVDLSTIVMKVNGNNVSPTITGNKSNYLLEYNPPTSFAYGETVEVELSACDLATRCMVTDTYSFAIVGPPPGTKFTSDDFNRCDLNGSIWSFVDPEGDSTFTTNTKHAIIEVPDGTVHDAWQTPNNNAPRLLQTISNADTKLEAKFESDVTAGFQFQGFLVQSNSTNFVRMDVLNNGLQKSVNVYSIVNDVASTKVKVVLPEDAKAPYYFLVRRVGSTWYAFYHLEGDGWTKVAQFTRSMTISQAGVFAGNAGSKPPAFTSVVDYVFNEDSPIAPEDGIALDLPVSVVGNGIVTKAPECGNPVTLTAVPEPGWYLQSWSSLSGAISGDANPLTTAFGFDDAVTATFEREEYALNVTLDHQGETDPASVTISPNNAIYYYGDMVTLIANTPTGWEFLGWSGDVDDVADPLAKTIVVTMTESRDLTATFISKHTLDLVVENRGEGVGGTVSQAPQGSSFYYGDEVQVTATPKAGWKFLGWYENDQLITSAEIHTLTIDHDMTLEALFAEIVTLDVNADGPGSVSVTPPANGQYLVGEVVTLTATPDTGFFFTGWSGTLTSSDNPWMLTLPGDTTLTASFSANQPPVWQPVGEQRIRVYQTWSLTLTAVDDDGDPLTLSLDSTSAPEGVSFKDNGNGSAEISWQPGVAHFGPQTIIVLATDGQATSWLTIDILVYGNALFLPNVFAPTP